jgi:hypothetical protein
LSSPVRRGSSCTAGPPPGAHAIARASDLQANHAHTERLEQNFAVGRIVAQIGENEGDLPERRHREPCLRRILCCELFCCRRSSAHPSHSPDPSCRRLHALRVVVAQAATFRPRFLPTTVPRPAARGPDLRRTAPQSRWSWVSAFFCGQRPAGQQQANRRDASLGIGCRRSVLFSRARGGSRTRESRTYGSVRGARGISRPYRDQERNLGYRRCASSRSSGR